jgi:hypothetical protein
MQVLCHRCGEALPEGSGESPFCPHCGSPQLYLSLENQSVETGGEPQLDATGQPTTGTLPPPRPRQVEWKTAIRCAALVAAIGSVLTLGSLRLDVLSPVSLLWIMSGSLITLGLYQRRRPTAWMDVRVGAHIGLVVGICMAVGLGISMAGWGLIARFALHSMGSFDAQMAAVAVQMQKTLQQKAAQQSTPVPAEVLGFIASPEYRAGIMLATFALGAGFVLGLSTLFGAFAGLLRMRRRPVA